MEAERGHGQHENRLWGVNGNTRKILPDSALRECKLSHPTAFHIISIRALIIYLAKATGSSLI